jgi:hypothetical protein
LALHRLPQKGLGCVYIATPAQVKIDGSPAFIHRSVKVHPFAAHLQSASLSLGVGRSFQVPVNGPSANIGPAKTTPAIVSFANRMSMNSSEQFCHNDSVAFLGQAFNPPDSLVITFSVWFPAAIRATRFI